MPSVDRTRTHQYNRDASIGSRSSGWLIYHRRIDIQALHIYAGLSYTQIRRTLKIARSTVHDIINKLETSEKSTSELGLASRFYGATPKRALYLACGGAMNARVQVFPRAPEDISRRSLMARSRLIKNSLQEGLPPSSFTMRLFGEISRCSIPAHVCSDSYPSMQRSSAARRLTLELAL